MKNLLILVSFILLGGFVTSCSTISKEQCQVGDWKGIGERDGSKAKIKMFSINTLKSAQSLALSPIMVTTSLGMAKV